MNSITTVIIMLALISLAVVFMILHGRSDKEEIQKIFAFLSGLCTCVAVIVMFIDIFGGESKHESKYNDGYYGTSQYYKDASNYYKDKDNWNRDYGDKYGYRY